MPTSRYANKFAQLRYRILNGNSFDDGIFPLYTSRIKIAEHFFRISFSRLRFATYRSWSIYSLRRPR